MRLLSKVVLAATLALGFVAAGHAQAPINPLLPIKGTREIEVRGNLFFRPSDLYDVQLGYGPFLSPNLQVKPTVEFSKSGSITTTNYGIEGNYHFPRASATLPFIGLFFGGVSQNHGGGNTTAYGAQAGIKQFINSSVAFTVSYDYRHPTKSHTKETDGIAFGLAFYLR